MRGRPLPRFSRCRLSQRFDAAGAASGRAAADAAVVDTARIRIDNFGRISSAYYRGAQPEGRDYADLAALGVKTVINLTSYDALADEPGWSRRPA